MPRAVLVAGPNLTIDRTATLDELRPGAVLRFERVVVTPGGKGLNVARAARALGTDALLVGLVPGETGRAGAGMIAREGIALRAVECGGELRSTAIVIERSGRTTVLNEPGPEIAAADWEAYEAAVAAELPAHGVLVCSGSVPPGAPDDAYARLAERAARAGRACVVDAAGVTLARALAARPDVVCPNVLEAEETLARADGPAAADDAAPGRDDAAPKLRAAGDEVASGRDNTARGDAAPRGEVASGRDNTARGDAAPRGEVASGRDNTARGVRDRAESAAAALVARGARAALVTADAAGAALATGGAATVWLPAPRIEDVRNPVGAGDVLASALAAALERGEPLLDAARHGVAAAAASVEWPTAGELDPARASELLAAVVAG